MSRISRVKWQEVEDAFLQGDLDEEAFCKSRHLDLSWFREELSKSDRAVSSAKKGAPLFVELLPQADAESLSCVPMKLRYCEVELEYHLGLGEATLREVLSAIREEL